MRKLLIFTCAFTAAVLLFLYLLPMKAACLLAAGAALSGLVLAFLRRKTLRRMAIVAFGLSVGFLWCICYQAIFYQPAIEAAGQRMTLRATVCDTPEETQYGCSLTALASLEGRQIRVLLYLPQEALCLKPGDRLETTAELKLSSDSGEEGGKNLYYNAQGVFLIGFADDFLPLEAAPPSLAILSAQWNQMMQERVARLVPPDASGMITALLTGGRDGLNTQQQIDMKQTGVYHTVAVSGMHVSILMGIVLFLTSRRRMLSALIGIPILVLFVLFIGGTPSVTRAAILYILFLVAPLLHREADSPTSLAAALLFLLLVNPWSAANIGLQLSFASVAGILLVGNWLDQWCRERIAKSHRKGLGWKAYRFVTASLSVTIGAMVFTVPLSALYFGMVSLIAPLANLLTLFAVTAAFTLGLAALATSFILWPLGTLLGSVAALPVRYFFWMNGLLSEVPFAAVYTQSRYVIWWLVFVYGMLFGIIMLGGVKRPFIPLCASVVTLGASLLLIAKAPDGAFSFSALDVGQGQCLVAESMGVAAVLDCGGDSASNAANTAAAFLQSHGKTKLELLALTHYDADHAGGAATLLYTIPTKTVLLPPGGEQEPLYAEILTAASASGAEVVVVENDSTWTIGDAVLQVFAPVSDTSDNESGISFLFSANGYDALVTGDLGTTSETRLIGMHELTDVEVIVAGHHGSAGSTGTYLLETLQPETALISVGENNYGHPAEEVLGRLRAAGVEIYRTDQCGTITVRR